MCDGAEAEVFGDEAIKKLTLISHACTSMSAILLETRSVDSSGGWFKVSKQSSPKLINQTAAAESPGARFCLNCQIVLFE